MTNLNLNPPIDNLANSLWVENYIEVAVLPFITIITVVERYEEED